LKERGVAPHVNESEEEAKEVVTGTIGRT